MRSLDWTAWLRRMRGTRGTASRARRQPRVAPRLGLTRLEERRVLNGGAVVVIALSADAGQGQSSQSQPAQEAVVIDTGSADGSPDVFEVVRGEADGKDLLQVEVNGNVVYATEFNRVQSVTFQGGTDQETLVIDFGEGNPIPTGGISFVGQAGSTAVDSLLFVHGSVDTVVYSFTGPTEGQVQFTSDQITSTVSFAGSVQTVGDSISAVSRTIELGGTVSGAAVHVAANQSAATQLDLNGGVATTFANPTGALTLADETTGPLAIDVSGLGAGFDASLTIAGQPDADISFSAPISVGAGNVQISGGSVTVDSSVESLGGTIEFSASERVVVSTGGVLSSTSGTVSIAAPQIEIDGAVLALNGGTIHLDAGNDGTLLVTGRIDASSDADGGTGGTIDLLGARVGLDGAASVDVSGGTGGGLVRIGGDYQGANPLVPNAERTYVGQSVTIDADAITSGTGGRVIVWADEITVFYGTVTARGGAQSGDGGFVEVSSAQSLVAEGTYDLTSSQGAAGTLLFDPLQILIVGGTADGSDNTDASSTTLQNSTGSNTLGSILFTDEGAGSPVPFVIYESEIENSNANIILRARQSISVSGTFDNNDLVIANNRSLTLVTRNQTADGAGGIDLTGSTAGANLLFKTQGTGGITIQASTAGQKTGNVVLSALSTANGSISVSAGEGSIQFAGDVSGKSLTVSATAGITIGAHLASVGVANFKADSDDDGVGVFSITPAGSVQTANSELAVSAADVSLQGALNAGSGIVRLSSSTNQTVGLGTAVAPFSVSGAELQQITAATLFFRTFGNTPIVVGDVTSLDTLHTDHILLQADNGITVVGHVVNVGFAAIRADSNGDGVGTFTVAAGASLTNTTGNLTISAGDVDLQGTIATGVRSLTLVVTAGNSVGIGNAAGTFVLSGAELQNISTTNLTIDASSGGSIVVDGVTAAQNATLSGTVTLLATAAGSDINFSGAASTFRRLTGQAGDAINVNAALTVTQGNLLLQSGNTLVVNQAIAAGVGTGGTLNVVGGVVINAPVSVAAGRTVSLITSGSLDLIITVDQVSASTIFLTAPRDIIVKAKVQTTSSTADIQLVADNDHDGVGGVWIQDIGSLISGRDVLIQGSDLFATPGVLDSVKIDADGANQQVSAAGAILITNSNEAPAGADIVVEGNLQAGAAIDISARNRILLSSSIVGGAGDVTFNQPVILIGTTSVSTTTGGIAFVGTINSKAGSNVDLTLQAGGAVSFSGQVGAVDPLGKLNVSGSASFVSSSSITAQLVTIKAAAGVTLLDSLTSNGLTTLDADTDADGTGTFTLAGGATLNTQSHVLSITSGDIDLAGSLNSGAAATSLLTTDCNTVGIGAVSPGVFDYTLTGTELSHITSASLTIGGANAGDMTVNGVTIVQSQNAGPVTLSAGCDDGATITFTGGASTFVALSASADGGMAVNTNVTTTVGNLVLDGDADDIDDAGATDGIAFASGVTLTSANSLTLSATTGDMTGAGALTLKAVNGVTLNDSLTTHGLTTIDADTNSDATGTFTLAALAVVDTSDNPLVIRSADIDLAGSLDSGTATTTLQATAITGAFVGSFGGPPNYYLSGAELQRVTAATLRLEANGIVVNAVTAAQSNNVGLVQLVAPGQIQFQLGTSTFNALSAASNFKIAVLSDVTTDVGDLSLDGDANGTPNGSDQITFAAGVTLTSAGSITLKATTGDMTAQGALTLKAVNGVTLLDSLTSSGLTTIDADTDADGTGTFTLAGGATLNTQSHVLSITSGDIDLAGSLNSGAAATSLLTTDCNTVGIGAVSPGVFDYTLTGTELSHITSASLTIGGANAGDMTVNGVTIVQSQNAGPVTLIAGCVDATLTFTGGDSDFNSLSGTANGDITVDAALTMHTGDLFLQSAQAINVNQPLTTLGGTGGQLFVSGGVSLNANVTLGAGNVTLIAGGLDIIITTDRIQATTIDLEAPRDIIIKALLETTAPGADIILVADTDNDGSGGVWIQTVGQVVSDRNVFIQGSNLFATGGLGGPLDSIRIDSDGTNDQINAAGHLTLQNSAFAPAGSDVILEGIVRATGTGAIDISALHAIRTSSLIASEAGAITFHSPVVLADDTQIETTSGNVSFLAAATINSDVGEQADLTVTSQTGDVSFGGAVGSSAPLGLLTVVSSHNITAVAVNTQQLSLTATNNISLNGNVTTTGPVTILADSDADGAGAVTVAAAATVKTSDNLLTITAASIDLQGALNSGSAITHLQNSTLGRQINLGTEVAGQLCLTDLELDRITAGVLQIGRRDALASGNILETASISPAHTAVLHLLTTADIVEIAGSISVSQLALEADGNMVMNGNNNVQALAVKIYGAGDTLSFKNIGGLTIGSIDGIVGLVTNGGDVSLNLGGALGQIAAADIHAAALELDVTGSILLPNAGNDVTTLAILASGAVGYRDGSDLVIGTAGTTSGVTSTGGPVSIRAFGTLTIAQFVEAVTATVGLQSDNAGIVDGNGAATDVTAANLALQAVTGIGSSDTLETKISVLAALNTGSGNIQIENYTGTELIIGAVGTLNGIQNSGGGNITVTNHSPLTVAGLVGNVGGGNITLTAVGDGTPGHDLTVNAPIAAIGGSGNINLNAGTDLIINDGGSPVDILTQNNGEITGIAQNIVQIGPNVIIQTGVGSISTLTPALDGVHSPQISNEGLAHVFGTFGDPGAHNFTITVNWSDGTVDTYHFDSPGGFDLTHVYTSNPDKTDQAAPIPITVTVFDDPNSHFIGLNQPPVSFLVTPTDVKTVANEMSSVLTFTNAPGEGLGFIVIDTTLKVPSLFFPPLATLVYTFDTVPLASGQSNSGNSVVARLDAARLQSREVTLIAMNAAGDELDKVALDEDVLDDLPALFRRLPDGRYRVMLKDPGERDARLLIEVNLRGGKPADDADSGQDKPPSAESSAIPAPATSDQTAAVGSSESATILDVLPPDDAIAAGMPETPADSMPAAGARWSVERPDSVHRSGNPLSVAALCGVAASTVVARYDWKERLDAALASGSKSRFSTAARLARRLRRQVASRRVGP